MGKAGTKADHHYHFPYAVGAEAELTNLTWRRRFFTSIAIWRPPSDVEKSPCGRQPETKREGVKTPPAIRCWAGAFTVPTFQSHPLEVRNRAINLKVRCMAICKYPCFTCRSSASSSSRMTKRAMHSPTNGPISFYMGSGAASPSTARPKSHAWNRGLLAGYRETLSIADPLYISTSLPVLIIEEGCPRNGYQTAT